MKAYLVFRIVAELAVLIVVWLHAHWSVALTLSLLSVSNEIQARFDKEVTAALREITKLFEVRK